MNIRFSSAGRFHKILGLVLLVWPLIATAIVGGQPSSDWFGVGQLTGSSGALISSRHVLTAAHVVDHSSSFNFSYLGQNYSYDVVSSIKHPDFGLGSSGDGLKQFHDDIAILTLAEDVPSEVPIYSLFDGDVTLGKDSNANPLITLVGYGGGAKRIAENRLDRFYAGDTGDNLTDNAARELLAYDYDGVLGNSSKDFFCFSANICGGSLKLEGINSPGDSGGPIFIDNAGSWEIIGVMTFVAYDPTYTNGMDKFGAFAGGTYIKPYQTWIDDYVNQVPEPETWALMLAGLALVAGAARRRRLR
jgi:secreted trypsin-like serine protease